MLLLFSYPDKIPTNDCWVNQYMNEYVNVRVHGTLRWTGVPSRVQSYLTASVPRIDFEPWTWLAVPEDKWMNQDKPMSI